MTDQDTTRQERKIQIPDVIIGYDLGAAKDHPDYVAAKSGSVDAGDKIANSLVNLDFVDRISQVAGNQDFILQPVHSIEANGINLIPHSVARRIAGVLDVDVGLAIVQGTSPKRTSMDGLERIFNRPEFIGVVEKGRNYILLDDTLTQGGTFAALEKHIVDHGGKVIGAVALTGKPYSAALQISDQTLTKLRNKHGDVEDNFRKETGRGFSELTESEARYLANFKPALTVRDRIVNGHRPAQRQDLDSKEPGAQGSEERAARIKEPSAAPASTLLSDAATAGMAKRVTSMLAPKPQKSSPIKKPGQ